jgi:hypothetical protein
MYKYLYGRWDVLSGLIEGKDRIRLCDLRHYARLENDNMRDDEAFRNFKFNPDSIELNIAGLDILPKDLVSNIKFKIPTRDCLCICFSNKKNDDELFSKFGADVCIEFNIEYLIELLKSLFEEQLGGEVVAKNVKYYSDNAGLSSLPAHEAVFTKSSTYEHEDEFRIAVFLPYDDQTVINHSAGKFKPIKICNCQPEDISNNKCQCYFAYMDSRLEDGFKSYICKVYKKGS